MCKKTIVYGVICLIAFLICGCTVRTYKVTKNRVDQDLSAAAGNRGYLFGEPKVSVEKDRKPTRDVQVIEIEAHPIRFGKKPTPTVAPKKVIQIQEEPILQPKTVVDAQIMPVKEVSMKKYTVIKGDTLQKISRKFYGTTKRWMEIWEI